MWKYCNLGLPAVTVLAAMTLSHSVRTAPADQSVLNQCRSAFAGTGFDCACPIRFLSKKFDQVDVDLILVLWGYAIDEHHKHNPEIQKLASQYGASRIDNVMYRFHSIRVDMLRQCPSDTRLDEEAY